VTNDIFRHQERIERASKHTAESFLGGGIAVCQLRQRLGRRRLFDRIPDRRLRRRRRDLRLSHRRRLFRLLSLPMHASVIQRCADTHRYDRGYRPIQPFLGLFFHDTCS
jgi:hypothetical protein